MPSPIGHRVARAAGPGWMLIGDAAGFIDPFTGEGIYRALRSARAAAESLAGGDRGAEDRYLDARQPRLRGQGRADLAGPGDARGAAADGLRAAPPRRAAGRRRHAWAARWATAGPPADALSPLFLAQVLRP